MSSSDPLYLLPGETYLGLWPIRPQPFPDELLSSWLVRLAWENGLKLQTFCAMMFGRDRPIWNRDIDKLADAELLEIVARGAGTTLSAAFGTTLAAYKGWIYQEHNRYGNSKWILPLGVYHRVRRGRGIQYCPKCLSGATGPYYRRRWRLGFIVVCPEHGTELLDECPACKAAICFHRREMGHKSSLPDGNIHVCFRCGQDLSRITAALVPRGELDFHNLLASGVTNGWVKAPDGTSVYAHLYFDVLHQIMKLLVSQRSRGLGSLVSEVSGIPAVQTPTGHFELEQLNVPDRHRLLLQARWLLTEWPERFLRLCRDNQIWSAWLLRDMTNVPWWFASVIQRELYVRFAPFDTDHNREWRRYKDRIRRGAVRDNQQAPSSA